MANKFEELNAFIEVVNFKSFSKAADRLDTAKSALSRRVSELEKRLNVQLLQRTTRKLFLTEQGEHFYEKAVQIVNSLEAAEQSISDEQIELKGRIKLALPLSFSNHKLSKLISKFACQYPQIDLKIDLNDRQIDLIEDGFDMAIRVGELQDSSLIAQRISDVSFVTCASVEFIKNYGVPSIPDDLKKYRGLYYSNTAERQLWEYKVNNKLVYCPPIRALTANNGDFLAQSAVNGLGVLHSPLFIVANDIRRGNLVPFLQKYEHTQATIYAVFPPGRLIPTRMRKLVEFIKAELL